MVKKIALLLFLSWLTEWCIQAQDSTIVGLSINRQGKILIGTMAGCSLGLEAIILPPYVKKSDVNDFHFFNDNKGFLQIDKFFHSYQSYVATEIWYKGLTKGGVRKESALFWGGAIGFAMVTPKEILDGFNSTTGLSWGDLIANAAGPLFYVGQELLFDEQVLRYKSSFSTSVYADQANGYLGRNVFKSYIKDYNGHTYWLSMNVRRVFPDTAIPDWICVAGGYSANGMFGMFENIDSWLGVEIPETQRYRQFLISLDVDWSKINVKSGFLRFLLNGLNYIKIPFPALEINSLGHIKGYYLYF